MIDEDKLKVRIEGLKSNLIHGVCSSQVAMETCCKEEAYNEVLAIIDSMQEDPKDKCKGCNNVKGCITYVDGSEWAHYKEPVSEDLESEIRHYYNTIVDDGFDFPSCAEIARYFANWQKEQMMKDARIYPLIEDPSGYMFFDLRMTYPTEKCTPRSKVKVITIKED